MKGQVAMNVLLCSANQQGLGVFIFEAKRGLIACVGIAFVDWV